MTGSGWVGGLTGSLAGGMAEAGIFCWKGKLVFVIGYWW